jgi:hypothetical protein
MSRAVWLSRIIPYYVILAKTDVKGETYSSGGIDCVVVCRERQYIGVNMRREGRTGTWSLSFTDP